MRRLLLILAGAISGCVPSLSVDAGAIDAGNLSEDSGADAGTIDGGFTDAGVPDGGMTDAGTIDGGFTDASVPDGGMTDAGAFDAGPTDAGAPDGGPPDAGEVDGGPLDAGVADGGLANDGGALDAGGASPDAGSSRCPNGIGFEGASPWYDVGVTASPGGNSRELVTADLDGDGRQDIVGLNGQVWILQSAGHGRFLGPRQGPAASAFDIAYLTPGGGASIAYLNGAHLGVYQWDGGVTEVPASADWSGVKVRGGALYVGSSVDGVLRFDLDGGAIGAPQPVWPVAPVYDLTLADVDGDGRDDLLTTGPTYFGVSYGGPDGGFGGNLQLASSGTREPIYVRDVTGDGRPDLLHLGTLWEGIDGGFIAHPSGPLGYGGLFDLDGDGRTAEWLTTGGGFGSAPILTFWDAAWNGQGRGLDLPNAQSIFPVLYIGLGEGDVDGDGRPDLLMLTANGLLGVHYATEIGLLSVPRVIPVDMFMDPPAVVFADVNGDLWPDAVIPRAVLPGLGGGRFGAAAASPVTWPPFFAADMDGDGRSEVIDSYYGHVWQAVAGGMSLRQTIPTDGTIWGVADFDLNGLPDALRYNAGAGTLGVFLQQGNGAFSLGPPFTGFVGRSGDVALQVTISDFNLDGRPDVVGPGDWWMNTGSAFARRSLGLSGETAVAVADFDEDGLPDVVALNGASFTWHRGDGTGGFLGAVPHPGSLRVLTRPAVGDFDGDGHLDLAFGHEIVRGHGDGTFETAERWGPLQYSAAWSADFDGDGRDDLVLVDGSNSGRWAYLFHSVCR